MGYHEILASMIKKSGLPLRKIADNCKEFHVYIDQSYISKLQRGRQAPASEEVNIALAKVCDSDPGDLLFSAYMEKAPEMIKRFLEALIEYFRDMAIFVYTLKNPQFAPLFKEQIKSLSNYQIIKDFLVEDMPVLRKSNRQMRRLVKDEKFQKYLDHTLPGLLMNDASMEPVIHEGAVLSLDLPENNPSSGDIVCTMFKNERYVIRRYISIDDKIILVADNSKYEPISVDKDNVMFFAKVISMTIPL
jgi:transcriptional regulator with XRE-family HTH domain